MNTSEIMALAEKFVSKTEDSLKKPFYCGGFVYATDGRICIRAIIPGAKYDGEGKVPAAIDRFCMDFETARPLPSTFADDILSDKVKAIARKKYVEHIADAKYQLSCIKTIFCPDCGEAIRVRELGGDIVDDDEYAELQREAFGKDDYEAEFPIFFSHREATGNEIINYKYALQIIAAVGKDGEYRFGLNEGKDGRYCFMARSADRMIDVVCMCMKQCADMITVGTPARKAVAV